MLDHDVDTSEVMPRGEQDLLHDLPELTAHRQVATWLSKFDRALSRHDIAAATELFVADSFWWDIVSLTW